MYQQIQDYAEETRHYGLVVVIWSYPHGSGVSKPGETAIDITGYAAHIAAQIGAHILRNKHLITPVFLVGAHGRAPLPAKKIVGFIYFTILKVKLPGDHVEQMAARKVYEQEAVPIATLTDRVSHIVQCSFNGRRIVIFSGGATQTDGILLDEIRAIQSGGGFGSIIGRNSFQRPKVDALKLLSRLWISTRRSLQLQEPRLQGEDVTAVQRALLQSSIVRVNLNVTGVFDMATERAVRQLQQATGRLAVDGVVGSTTLRELGLLR